MKASTKVIVVPRAALATPVAINATKVVLVSIENVLSLTFTALQVDFYLFCSTLNRKGPFQ